MICENSQKLTMGFIKGELDIKTQSDYLKHIEECKNCREELEIMHIVSVGLDDLEGKNGVSYNFPVLLARRIENAKFAAKLIRKRNKLFTFVSAITYMLLSITIIWFFR